MNSIPVYVLVVFAADKAAPILEGSNVYNDCAHGHKTHSAPNSTFYVKSRGWPIAKAFQAWHVDALRDAFNGFRTDLVLSLSLHENTPESVWIFLLKFRDRKSTWTELFVAKIAGIWATFIDPEIPLKKFMWVPFLHYLPRSETHKLFPGAQHGGSGWGPKSLCWICLFAFSAILGNVRWRNWFVMISVRMVCSHLCICSFPPKACDCTAIDCRTFLGGVVQGALRYDVHALNGAFYTKLSLWSGLPPMHAEP